MTDIDLPEFDSTRIAVFDALAALGDLPLEDTEALVPLLEAKKYPVGTVLFEPGSTADTLYFIGAGRLSAEEPSGGRTVLSRGRMAGWPEVLTEANHSKRLTVQREALLYELPSEKLQTLLEERPAIARHLLIAISNHAIDTTGADDLRAQSQLIGLIADEGLGADRTEEALQAFTAALPTSIENTVVDFERFCSLLGRAPQDVDFADPSLADVIADLESNTTHLVLIARASDPQEWVAHILAAVDTAVVLVNRDRPDPVSASFAAPDQRRCKLGLVLIARDQPEPQSVGLHDVFAQLAPDWHYQISIGNADRWASIVRMSTGRASNLVMSGGGSLGALHMGVLKALQEAGYPIDSVGGTSVGGAIAVGVGFGIPAEEIYQRFRWLFQERKAFKSYALPIFGAINPSRYDSGLAKITDSRDFESMEIPTFACAANLNTKNLDVLRSGPGWQAMRSTSSIPGALPAFVREGQVLVDGGVLNNFPTRVALDLFGGSVTGITLKLGTARDIKTKYENRPSAFRALMANFGLTKRRDFPTLGKIVSKTLVLSASKEMSSAMDHTDFLFEPQVPADVSFMNFDALDRLFDVGYQYARARLEEDDTKPAVLI